MQYQKPLFQSFCLGFILASASACGVTATTSSNVPNELPPTPVVSANPPVSAVASTVPANDPSRNPLMGKTFFGFFGEISFNAQNYPSILIQRWCGYENPEYCDELGISDEYDVDSLVLQATKQYTDENEELSNAWIATSELYGDNQTITIKTQVNDPTNQANELDTYIMTYSSAPCQDSSHGAGLEMNIETWDFAYGPPTDDKYCEAFYEKSK
jgi:hypothetical protein